MGVRIKSGDTVKVIAGRESGKTGEVERVLPKEDRVVVGGVNIRTRHAQPSQNNQQGLYTFEAPLHASNVMVIDPSSGEPTRVGFRVKDNGQKVRVAKRSGKDMD
jgi:large subunit ribosomal protein L24